MTVGLQPLRPAFRGPQLEQQLNSKGFTLGHYPQSFDYSSLGGWVVTRSSGQQSRHYGRIEQLFAGGDVLTPRGSLKLPPFPASAAGPDLRQILLGSEGRMGVLTNVVVKIVALPEKDDVYGVFFPSWERAVHAVQTIAGTDIIVFDDAAEQSCRNNDEFGIGRQRAANSTSDPISAFAGHIRKNSLHVPGGIYRISSIDGRCPTGGIFYHSPVQRYMHRQTHG